MKYRNNYFFWVDIATCGGTNPEKGYILELAAVITDFDLNRLASYHRVYAADQYIIGCAKPWEKKVYKANNLFSECLAAQWACHNMGAWEELETFISTHCDDVSPIPAGRHIQQKMMWIETILAPDNLHHNYFDCCSLYTAIDAWGGLPPPPPPHDSARSVAIVEDELKHAGARKALLSNLQRGKWEGFA